MAVADFAPDLSCRVAGSFRDPSGYVFQRGSRVYRAVNPSCHRVLQDLAATGLLRRLIDDGLLVSTRFVECPQLRSNLAAENPGYRDFLEHEPVVPITYPYEWSVSMLADAALATLDLQLQLLEAGYSLKDATAYNVQFSAGRPVFIDVASIEVPERLDLWYALGQFNRMFTFPLILARHRTWDLRSYFLGAPDGRQADQVARAFGTLGRWRPSLLVDVTLPAVLGRFGADRSHEVSNAEHARARDRMAQRFNLIRLRRKVTRLAAGYRPTGVWTEYKAEMNYDSTAEAAKRALVGEFLRAGRLARVLDLGCNTGDYSYLAAGCGSNVAAVDGEHDAIELLYRRLRKEPASITPIINDLLCPSPGFGFRNRERSPLVERAGADCVLALALVHHLLVNGNLSLSAVRDQLHDLTMRDLVVEYVPPEDRQFKRLFAARRERFDHLSLDRFRGVFLKRFALLREASIPHTSRTLLFLRRRD
jgi:hypothetical protein